MTEGRRGLLLLLAALMLSGCMVGPDYEAPGVPVGEEWVGPPEAMLVEDGSPAATNWWKSLRDPVLDELVERA